MTKNKNKHLLSLPMFWVATIIPLFASAILMAIISYYDNLSLGLWNSENIGIAYTHFKVPLVIASLAFPLGAVVIASHRSAQTLMMADLQSSQNRFANYFLHLDRFRSELKGTDFNSSFGSLRTAHDVFYPDLLSHGSIQINDSIAESASDTILKLNMAASIINKLTPKWKKPTATSPIPTSEAQIIRDQYQNKLIEYFSNTETQTRISNLLSDVTDFNKALSLELNKCDYQPYTLSAEFSTLFSSVSALNLLADFSGTQAHPLITSELSELIRTYDYMLVDEIKKKHPEVIAPDDELVANGPPM